MRKILTLIGSFVLCVSMAHAQMAIGPNTNLGVTDISDTNPAVSLYCGYAYDTSGAAVLHSVDPVNSSVVGCVNAPNDGSFVNLIDPVTLGLTDGQQKYFGATTVDSAGNESAIATEFFAQWAESNPFTINMEGKVTFTFPLN